MEQTSQKQQMTGIVVSDKMDKTVVVEIHITKRHPKYHKSYTKSVKYKAHDAENAYHVGDKVVVESVRPISRDKKFAVIKKLN